MKSDESISWSSEGGLHGPTRNFEVAGTCYSTHAGITTSAIANPSSLRAPQKSGINECLIRSHLTWRRKQQLLPLLVVCGLVLQFLGAHQSIRRLLDSELPFSGIASTIEDRDDYDMIILN